MRTLFLSAMPFVLAFGGCSMAAQEVPFDRVAWKNNADPGRDVPTIRQRMLKDLQGRHLFIGLHRRELSDLLGNSAAGSASGFPQWDVIYILGPERGGSYSLDDEALGFKFDDDDRVVEWGVSIN